MSAPVTAEELAEIARAEDFGEWWEEEPGEGCVYEYTDEGARRIVGPIEPQDAAEVVRTRDRMFRLARDLTAERAEIQAMANMLDEAGIGHRDGDTVRSRLARMIADANTEAERTEQAEADRDALAAKIETMLADEEDARALRIAEHAAREDVAGQLAELQAAVRAHEAAAKGDPSRLIIAAERMWAAAKT